MNTTGKTEMGDPNNAPVKKGFFQRNTRNKKLNRTWKQMYSNWGRERARHKQNMNSLREKKKGFRNKKKMESFEKMTNSIKDAMYALYILRVRHPVNFNDTNKGRLENFETKRDKAIQDIFLYIIDYQGLGGRPYIFIIDHYLNFLKEKFMADKYNSISQIVAQMMIGNARPPQHFSFWGNILPRDEEALKQAIENPSTEKISLIPIRAHLDVRNWLDREEKNPMLQPPNASSLPMPNNAFKNPIIASNGGKRTRKSNRSKRSTRKQ